MEESISERELKESSDDLIVAIVSHILLYNAGAESDSYLCSLLMKLYGSRIIGLGYCDGDVKNVLEILRAPLSQYGSIVPFVIETRDPLLIRLCACLSADFHGLLLNSGASERVPFAFCKIHAVVQKIREIVAPVRAMAGLRL